MNQASLFTNIFTFLGLIVIIFLIHQILEMMNTDINYFGFQKSNFPIIENINVIKFNISKNENNNELASPIHVDTFNISKSKNQDERAKRLHLDNKVPVDNIKRIAFVRIQKTSSKLFSYGIELGILNSINCGYNECRCQSYDNSRSDMKDIKSLNGLPCINTTCSCDFSSTENGKISIFWENAPHMSWYDHVLMASRLNINEKNIAFLTLLRDPVTRVISEYKHVKSKIIVWDYSLPKNCYKNSNVSNVTLYEYVMCEFCNPGVSNRQSRMLSGFPHYLKYNTEIDQNKLLIEAKLRLEKTKWFGLYNRLIESVWLLQKTFPNAKYIGTPSYADKSDGYDLKSIINISNQLHYSEAIKLIKYFNQIDQQLFDFATKLFDKRLNYAEHDFNLKSINEENISQ